MRDLPAPLAFFIVIALALIVAVVSDNSRNKDLYSECQSDFKKNPYSFSKDRLVECNFLNFADAANLTRDEAIKKVLDR